MNSKQSQQESEFSAQGKIKGKESHIGLKDGLQCYTRNGFE